MVYAKEQKLGNIKKMLQSLNRQLGNQLAMDLKMVVVVDQIDIFEGVFSSL